MERRDPDAAADPPADLPSIFPIADGRDLEIHFQNRTIGLRDFLRPMGTSLKIAAGYELEEPAAGR